MNETGCDLLSSLSTQHCLVAISDLSAAIATTSFLLYYSKCNHTTAVYVTSLSNCCNYLTLLLHIPCNKKCVMLALHAQSIIES